MRIKNRFANLLLLGFASVDSTDRPSPLYLHKTQHRVKTSLARLKVNGIGEGSSKVGGDSQRG